MSTEVPAQTSVVILATMRSGSSWVASLLRNTSRMGKCREWFTGVVWPNVKTNPLDLPPEGDTQAQAFLAALRRASSTANGVYAVKIVSSSWAGLPLAVARWGVGDGTSDAWLHQIFPRPAVLVLRLRDLVGQAISLWRARETNQYGFLQGESKEVNPPDYDFAALSETFDEVKEYEAALNQAETAFAQNPYAVLVSRVYEDIIDDPVPTIQTLAQAAKIELDEPLELKTCFQVQRDAWTVAIRKRFEAELSR